MPTFLANFGSCAAAAMVLACFGVFDGIGASYFFMGKPGAPRESAPGATRGSRDQRLGPWSKPLVGSPPFKQLCNPPQRRCLLLLHGPDHMRPHGGVLGLQELAQRHLPLGVLGGELESDQR